MRSDGQVLYEAYCAAAGATLRWDDIGEAARIVWEQAAAKMELHFAQRMRDRLDRMARS